MDYWAAFAALAQELRQNRSIEVVRFELLHPAAGSAGAQGRRMKGVPRAAREFYAQVGAVRLEWQSRVHEDPDVAGRVNILPLDRVLQDWKGDIYFEEDATAGSRRFFRPFDFFVPEAAAGILIRGEPDEQVYLYTYDDEPFPLGVDLAGYIELLLRARGFLYWQMIPVALALGRPSAEALRFRSAMPQLFPGFDPGEFERLYRRLRFTKG